MLITKKVVDKACITESVYRAYELGDRNPKPEILDRIVKVLGVRPEYLSAPAFRNRCEFALLSIMEKNAGSAPLRQIGVARAES